MNTLKQEIIATISNLPDTADMNEIAEVLIRIRQKKETELQINAVSCLDMMQDYIGCIQGDEDISINKAYMEKYGL